MWAIKGANGGIVHGLGGSLAQFHHLLTSLSNVASCFGIDLPGCGPRPVGQESVWSGVELGVDVGCKRCEWRDR
jgi:hypothetical protein